MAKDYKDIKEELIKALKTSNDEGILYKYFSLNSGIELSADGGEYLVSLRYPLMRPLKNPFFGRWSTDYPYLKAKYLEEHAWKKVD